ncbi:hypothetical protein [Chondromyces crocatus]|uniref:Lipoprotein n=1 Tax=Chondromyces crocatus TaxID=52 RepID=A0A0K1EE10_CHOCO|nr:hypothetical protein [Chondromyces crocatus]AKT39079.1 uncharacterized protein CMC5_032260 [Chondromyces crocatus]
MRVTPLRVLPVITLLGLVACSAEATSNEFTSGGNSGSGGPGGTGGEGGGLFPSSSSTGIDPGPGPGSDCSEAAKLVYVLSTSNELYSFRPDARQFTRIGTMNCGTSLSPNSMAVDRDATAWVNYTASNDSAGAIFKVSTEDASCAPAASVTLPSGWTRLGMGFSSDVAGGDAESLFVAGTAGISGVSPGLGRIALDTGVLTPIGPFSGNLFGQSAELTGTGEGKLFGFFTSIPVQVAEIDKATGATGSAVSLPNVEIPSAWAFSFWGGDFYLYTAPSNAARTSNVTRYRPSDGTIDTGYMTNVGFRIVGAGVSTCAPITPPQ